MAVRSKVSVQLHAEVSHMENIRREVVPRACSLLTLANLARLTLQLWGSHEISCVLSP